MARKAGNTPPKSPRGPRRRASPRAADEAVVVDDSIGDEQAPAVEIEEFHPVDNAGAETLDAEYKRAQPADETTNEPAETGESGALVPLDPLGRYLAEIRRFPLLTREEEAEIAKRYHRHHHREDAFRLVTANLRLVVKIALEFARASRNVLDLIQEGNVGLMEAVKNFDPYRGIRFPSYAVWWVRAYIYRYLINNWRLVKIGTTQAQRKLFFNLRKESERLEAQGFRPEPKLLAQRMGVKESEVREMQDRMSQSEVSLDQPSGQSEDVALVEVLPDNSDNPEEAAAADEWRNFARERVEEFAATLKDKELEIFNQRLLTEDPATLQEIGERFGISRERVRQIETRLKNRLRDFIRGKAADVDQAS
ncbi:MAG TPA: RNA polymerase factor sigma-32 [Candidatus Binataceae bacterium]|nr:RNA polymerase factor sigma-32 [Candidatus Binataceae bacterium]